MQEDEQNADWTDETNHEEEDGEQLTAHRAPIRQTHHALSSSVHTNPGTDR